MRFHSHTFLPFLDRLPLRLGAGAVGPQIQHRTTKVLSVRSTSHDSLGLRRAVSRAASYVHTSIHIHTRPHTYSQIHLKIEEKTQKLSFSCEHSLTGGRRPLTTYSRRVARDTASPLLCASSRDDFHTLHNSPRLPTSDTTQHNATHIHTKATAHGFSLPVFAGRGGGWRVGSSYRFLSAPLWRRASASSVPHHLACVSARWRTHLTLPLLHHTPYNSISPLLTSPLSRTSFTAAQKRNRLPDTASHARVVTNSTVAPFPVLFLFLSYRTSSVALACCRLARARPCLVLAAKENGTPVSS